MKQIEITPHIKKNNERPGAPASGRARRARPVEERRRIVEATFAPGVSVAEVARRHGINANQIFTWRRQYRTGKLGRGTGAVAQGFIPIEARLRAPAAGGLKWNCRTG